MIETPDPVVLASSSATRCELLKTLVNDFEVVSPDIDESTVTAQNPGELAVKLAEAKARRVAQGCAGALIIAADTLVVCGGQVIGKPTDRADAVRILGLLTRHAHEVLTGVFVIAPDGRVRSVCVAAAVRMHPMSREQIEEYVDRTGSLDRAGAYALRPDDPLLESLDGSIAAVMGLPVDEVGDILRELYPSAGATA